MTPADFNTKFQEAWVLRNEGRYEEVLALATENLSLAEKAEDMASKALFLKLFAQIHHDQGELREALKYYKQLEKAYITVENLPRQMHALRHIGMLFYELKEYECAEKCLIQVVRFIGQRTDMEAANSFRVYALALAGIGEKSRSLAFWKKARNIYQAHGIEEGVAECDAHLT